MNVLHWACICSKNYDPVCGVDGVTYGNNCYLECANIEKENDGECGMFVFDYFFIKKKRENSKFGS